jgi:type II secretory pathway component PulK
MSLEYEDAGTQLHQIRARNLASGGVYAAIGDLQAGLAEGRAPQNEYDISLSTYRREQGGPGAYAQSVEVGVSDESGRVNLNAAPATLLQTMGLSAEATATLSSMRGENERLASVDALRVENVVDASEYAALDTELFTVFTDGDVNLNAGGPDVLAAVFGVSRDEAAAVAQKRPFRDWADALQKVGREPSTFNLDVAPFAPRQQPAGVSFASQTFRLRSTVAMNMPGGNHRPAYAGVEAVVAFDADGNYSIRYWREMRGGEARGIDGPAAEGVTAEDAGEEAN